jgi:hypothetical protein
MLDVSICWDEGFVMALIRVCLLQFPSAVFPAIYFKGLLSYCSKARST